MLQIGNKKQISWLWLSFLVIALDQLIKYIVVKDLHYNEPITILPVFDLTLTSNRGGAWGFLNSANCCANRGFIVVSIIVSIALVLWIYRSSGNHWQSCAISLILGGAVGNLIDRFTHGYVIDFIQIHFYSSYFPDFNIADLAITSGAILICFFGNLKQKIRYQSN